MSKKKFSIKVRIIKEEIIFIVQFKTVKLSEKKYSFHEKYMQLGT